MGVRNPSKIKTALSDLVFGMALKGRQDSVYIHIFFHQRGHFGDLVFIGLLNFADQMFDPSGNRISVFVRDQNGDLAFLQEIDDLGRGLQASGQNDPGDMKTLVLAGQMGTHGEQYIVHPVAGGQHQRPFFKIMDHIVRLHRPDDGVLDPPSRAFIPAQQL